jgi:hypothetical protein
MKASVPRETWWQRRVREFQSFDVWRRAVTANLILVPLLILGYWVLWFFVERSIVASDSTAQYIAFEQAFPLSDAFLMVAAAFAALQLWRGRSSALALLLVLGGGGIYLFGLDVLYDLEHGVYADGGAGLIELGINFYTLISGIGVIYFGWHFQRELLAD